MAPAGEKSTSVISRNQKIVKSAILEFLVIGLIAGCVMLISQSFTTVTSVSAARSIMNGEAKGYHSEQLRRREISRDPEFSNIALDSLTFIPYVLFFDDLTYYPEHGFNKAMAEFYGKASIRLIYDLSLYHVGDTVNFGLAHDEFDSSRRYFVFGLDHLSNQDFTLSSGNAAMFRGALEASVDTDLQLNMTVNIYQHNEMYAGQSIMLYVNGFYIDEVFLSFGGTDVFHNITFNIPRDFVTGRNFIELMFEFPDAYEPMEEWEDSTDDELRAIGFKSITLTQYP
jgi:hypothetical protein